MVKRHYNSFDNPHKLKPKSVVTVSKSLRLSELRDAYARTSELLTAANDKITQLLEQIAKMSEAHVILINEFGKKK